MCLLKRELKETNCGHEKCKNFYMLNKQMCMFNLVQPQSNTQQNSNAIFQLQGQTPVMTAQTFNPAALTQQSFNQKRILTPPDGNFTIQEGESVTKRIKPDFSVYLPPELKMSQDQTSFREIENNQAFVNDKQANMSDLARISQLINANNMNNGSLNNMMVNGVSNGRNSQAETSFAPYTNGSLIVPITQGHQNNLKMQNNLGNISLPPNQQIMFNPLEQLLNANNQANSLAESTPPMDTQTKLEGDFSGEDFLREFQSKTFNLLLGQNKMLMDLKEKNDVVQDTLACLINEMNDLKSSIKQKNKQSDVPLATNPGLTQQFAANSSETGTVETLLNFLYGPQPDFQYHLVLKSDLPLPLYRERNFKFTVVLTDNNGNIVENANKIPLTIAIYSSEQPPKFIDVNTAGNKILKGFTEKDLVDGSATFEKIQIKEVTSHFRNGWIFLVVYPKISTLHNNNVLRRGEGVNVNSQRIKPLILEKVIVKAKKSKEKDQLNDNDEKDEKDDDIYQDSNKEDAAQ